MATPMPSLPIDDCLPQLKAALAKSSAAVLVAPPGAGKTTWVPLALIDQLWVAGNRIIMLEPRRIAARSAANYMANLLGEKVGETVGYRVRMDSQISANTRIEVVTEGVFTRMILDDPELDGIAAVLFDEFHERSLDGDLGLALALDVQAAFRTDLRILPMSATMDGARVAELFEHAEIIESAGRAFPIKIEYRDKLPNERVVETMVRVVRQVLAETTGSILCFLPGQGEILRTADLLNERLPDHVDITPLYGALSSAEQDQAIRPAGKGRRKIVLATSVAETSITIEGVRVVIDCGLSRVARYEADTGLTRLETIRAAKASINQRAGRAGRTQAGLVVRLWHEGQTASLPEFERPEILEADLSMLVLDLAQWGVGDPATLKWLDTPPAPSWKEAVTLLKSLGALNEKGAISDSGKAMRALALPPRLAMMVMRSAEYGQAQEASMLAVLLSERGLGGISPDLADRLNNAKRDKSQRAQKAKALAARIAKKIDSGNQRSDQILSHGAMLSFAYPDRIAKRVGANERGEALYRLANGRRARLDGLSALSKSEYLVIAEMQGTASSSRIFSAAEIKFQEIHRYHGSNIQKQRKIWFSTETKQLHATQSTLLGSLELASQPASIEPEDGTAEGLINALREHGLGLIDFGNKAGLLRARLGFLHYHLPDKYPDMSEEHLLDGLEQWLLPFIINASSFADITPNQLVDGLMHLVGYEKVEEIDRLAPSVFVAPTGSETNLKYEGEKAILQIRVQELYGLRNHPTVLGGKLGIQLELVSPAHRLIQTTMDLPRFWAGSWQDVKKEMKGRYPKHFWPEDPTTAAPTKKAKPRKMKN